MATLKFNDIAKLAVSAGFDPRNANIAAAVALAESGGNTDAHNSTPPDDSYGLWQINMLGSLGPTRRQQFGIANNSELFKPEVNAKAAFTVFKGAGNTFRPWTTFTSGKYRQYLDDGGLPSQTADAVGDVKDQVKDVPGAITNATNAFAQTFFKGLANTGGLAVALVLLVLGVVILLREKIPAKKIVKAIT